MISARQRSRLRACTLPFLCLVAIATLFFTSVLSPNYGTSASSSSSTKPATAKNHRHDRFHNLLLSEAQCKATFPKLTQQLEEMKALGPFDLNFRNRVVLQGKIENGEVSFDY